MAILVQTRCTVILLVFQEKKQKTLSTKKRILVSKKKEDMSHHLCPVCRRRFTSVFNQNRHTARCKRVVRYCPLCGDGACGKVRCRSEPIHETAVPSRLSSTPDGVELFKTHWSAIQTGVRINGVCVSIVNIRLPTGKLSDAIDSVRQIHITQRFRYKVGLSVGLILQHTEDTARLRYFHASQNHACLLDPLPTVSDSE